MVTWPDAWEGLLARVAAVFAAFQDGWSSQDMARARAFLSDNLFQTQLYWIDAYRKAGLRNTVDGARILAIQLSRVVSDRHCDAITVRVYATGHDYTVNGSGEVVAGSRTEARTYREHWTLIRAAGRRGAPRTDAACPNCGAPLAINMAGHCGHCNAKVTSGEFDWVLSRIEQDEAYG